MHYCAVACCVCLRLDCAVCSTSQPYLLPTTPYDASHLAARRPGGWRRRRPVWHGGGHDGHAEHRGIHPDHGHVWVGWCRSSSEPWLAFQGVLLLGSLSAPPSACTLCQAVFLFPYCLISPCTCRPIADNAGGIVEMSQQPESVRRVEVQASLGRHLPAATWCRLLPPTVAGWRLPAVVGWLSLTMLAWHVPGPMHCCPQGHH